MKKLNRPLWILVFLACITSITAQVAVTPDGSAPHASAMLDVKSTDKGILVPRMSSVQRTAVASPAQGLLVYDLTTESFWFYTGATWEELISGYTSTLRDADNDTKVQVEESPDDDKIRFDIAGEEKLVLRNNANGASQLHLIGLGNNTFLGNTAGNATAPILWTSGDNNSFIGAYSGLSNNTGRYNTAQQCIVIYNH